MNSSHTHYACSFIFCPDSSFEIYLPSGKTESFKAAFLPSNFPHKLLCKSKIIVMQVDPDIMNPMQDLALKGKKLIPLDEKKIFDDILDPWNITNCEDAYQFVHSILNKLKLIETPQKKQMDYRIQKVLSNLKALEEIPPRIKLEEISNPFQLSTDRFRHLFVENVGINLRRYLLWLRIRKIGKMLSKGYSLTDSAHFAGFSDSAHFSKTFKENFGINPSSLLLNPDIRFHYCENTHRIKDFGRR